MVIFYFHIRGCDVNAVNLQRLADNLCNPGTQRPDVYFIGRNGSYKVFFIFNQVIELVEHGQKNSLLIGVLSGYLFQTGQCLI